MKILNRPSLLIVALATLLTACSGPVSDEERILQEVDSTSVHLALGLKILTSNPQNDPEITAAQDTLDEIFKSATEQQVTEGLTLTQMGQLAKVAYQAKQLGKEEVLLGKSSEFKYLSNLLNADGAERTVEQDHATTLAILYMLKFHPSAPLPISDQIFLYEAWMAGDTEFDNQILDDLLRAAQVSTFARNDFCDFAWHKADILRQTKLGKVNPEVVINSITSLMGMGHAAAHVPEGVAMLMPIILAPAIVELMPGLIRVKAHVETAGCFDRQDNAEKAVTQYQYTVEAMENMGVPPNELALFKAALAYKRKDFEMAKKHLENAAKSKLLDQRSKQDLLTLADNIQSPDDSLMQQYFSTANLSITIGKIVNQRLIDEGFYQNIGNMAPLKSLEKMLEGLSTPSPDELLDSGKDLFDKLVN